MNGHNGSPGRDGRDGAEGEKGVAGAQGPRGIKGETGEKGVAGPHGLRGIKGEAGKVAAEQRYWKQCAWKKIDESDIGLIKVSSRQLQISLLRPNCRNSKKRLSNAPVLRSLLSVFLRLIRLKRVFWDKTFFSYV